MNKPIIIALCGPAASGKDTLANELWRYMKMENIACNFLVSDTTRPMRPREKEGVDYFFRTEAEFFKKFHNGDYLEWTEYRNWFYATDKRQLQNGYNLGVLNLSGILSLKHSGYTVIPIFLKVPFLTRMKRYKERAGKFTLEQFRRAWADMNDFANADLYLESLFPRSYLVLKNSNIFENCQKITQHLVSLGLE